jgi:hypothetical protein
MKRLILILLAVLTTQAACDNPKPRTPPPPPAPPYAHQALPQGERERLGEVRWNGETGAFEMGGQPLRTARLWTFDGSTDGFTLLGGTASIEPGGGLRLVNTAGDPLLMSPKALAIPGGRYPLVIIRLTRTAPAERWAGHLFYFTPEHGPSEALRGSPTDRQGPGVGETVTLVYDMGGAPKTAEDWAGSQIDQLRFDTDDAAGGEFVIRQIAVAARPAAPPAQAAPG